MKSSNVGAFVRDNGIVILGTVIFNLKAFVLMPLIIKLMGVEVYGGYVLLITLLGIGCNLSGLGVGITAKRYLPSADSLAKRQDLYFPQLSFTFICLTVVAVVLFLAEDFISSRLFDNNVSLSSYALVVYVITYFAYSQGVDYFRYTSRLPFSTLNSTMFPYMQIGIIMLFLYFFDVISVELLILSEAASAGFIGLICFVRIYKEIGLQIRLFSLEKLIKEIRLGLPLAFTVIVDFVLAASDRFLLLFFLSVTAVGYYQPGYLLGSLVIFLPKAMGTAMPQLLSKALDRGEEESAKRMVEYTIKLFLLFAIPYAMGTLILGKPVLALLANTEVAENAYLISTIVAIATIFYGLTYLIDSILFSKLETGVLLRVNLLAAGVNLMANVVLLYFIRDIMVAAATTLLSYLVAFVYVRHKLTKIWTLCFDWKYIVKIMIAAAVMTLSGLAAERVISDWADIHKILVLLLLSFLVYSFSLLCLKPFSSAEFNEFKQRMRSRGEQVETTSKY